MRRRRRGRWTRTVLITLGGIIVVALAGVAWIADNNQDIHQEIVSPIDISTVADGVYAGSYHSGIRMAEVEITIRSGRIIAMRHLNPGQDGTSRIADDVAAAIISSQSLDIDVISGASLSTKILQKAVEDALTRATRRQ